MIALDLAVQSTAGDPESSRGLCQISMRGLQRPFNGEVLEVIETCGLGGDGRCGCSISGCRRRCLENFCRQILSRSLSLGTRQHQTLDYVSQLANVAGPAVRFQQRHDFGAEVLFRYSMALR